MAITYDQMGNPLNDGTWTYTWFGDPIPATSEGVEDTVIKIVYENGEYELINWKGQSRYLAERGLKYYAGYRVFEEQQFETLIKNILAG